MMFLFVLYFFLISAFAGIADTLSSSRPSHIPSINGKESSVVIGDMNSNLVFKIYFSPLCEHCSLFLSELLYDPLVKKLIAKKNVSFLLLPVAFYQKLDKHAIELAASVGSQNFFNALKIFSDKEFNCQDLFSIQDALMPEESPTYSKEIVDAIKAKLEKYLNILKKKRASQSLEKKEVSKEILVSKMLMQISSASTFNDTTYSNMLYLRRDDITTEKNELSVPTLFIWDKDKKAWGHWKENIEASIVSKYLNKIFNNS